MLNTMVGTFKSPINVRFYCYCYPSPQKTRVSFLTTKWAQPLTEDNDFVLGWKSLAASAKFMVCVGPGEQKLGLSPSLKCLVQLVTKLTYGSLHWWYSLFFKSFCYQRVCSLSPENQPIPFQTPVSRMCSFSVPSASSYSPSFLSSSFLLTSSLVFFLPPCPVSSQVLPVTRAKGPTFSTDHSLGEQSRS